MRHGSLFSGIGGFDLAAEWMGWNNDFHCEWNQFGQRILKHYWPNAISYDDITKTDFSIHRGTIDILSGGFPCQPYSTAGLRKGKEDERHLWPHMLRAIREIKPRWVVGENVRGLVNWNGGMVFEEVQADLEAAGYEVQPYLLPASGIDAPHQRERIWFVAYASSNGHESRVSREDRHEAGESQSFGEKREWVRDDYRRTIEQRNAPNTESQRSAGLPFGAKEEYSVNGKSSGNRISPDSASEGSQKSGQNKFRELSEESREGMDYRPQLDGVTASNSDSRRQPREKHGEKESGRTSEKSLSDYWENFPTQSPICDGDDGISSRLDGITFSKWRNESIKGGGNAIVPQVAYQIFKAIERYNNLTQ